MAFHSGGDQSMLDYMDGGEPSVSICLHDEEFTIFAGADSFEQFIDSLFIHPDMR